MGCSGGHFQNVFSHLPQCYTSLGGLLSHSHFPVFFVALLSWKYSIFPDLLNHLIQTATVALRFVKCTHDFEVMSKNSAYGEEPCRMCRIPALAVSEMFENLEELEKISLLLSCPCWLGRVGSYIKTLSHRTELYVYSKELFGIRIKIPNKENDEEYLIPEEKSRDFTLCTLEGFHELTKYLRFPSLVLAAGFCRQMNAGFFTDDLLQDFTKLTVVQNDGVPVAEIQATIRLLPNLSSLSVRGNCYNKKVLNVEKLVQVMNACRELRVTCHNRSLKISNTSLNHLIRLNKNETTPFSLYINGSTVSSITVDKVMELLKVLFNRDKEANLSHVHKFRTSVLLYKNNKLPDRLFTRLIELHRFIAIKPGKTLHFIGSSIFLFERIHLSYML
ncbi:unnamed protein product [Caenorhabditis auriculariae]|uniref:Uncharacterized protein n=1 Tax=Caenorhabditis auriculariae TaxID=2777116 RepID=A0A8S1HCY2_9PELO|nr:unnamed protein product [Caenorhabditis auriculariae]